METAAAMAEVIAAEAEVETAAANRVETAAATTAAIAEANKVFFPQEGPAAESPRRAIFLALAEDFYQFHNLHLFFDRDAYGLREFQTDVIFRSLAGDVPDRRER